MPAGAAASGGLDEPPARRADPRPIPSRPGGEALTGRPSRPQAAAHAQSNVLFLNYDGATITYTGEEEDSATNITQFPDLAGKYAPYGAGARRAASMQAVESDWAKYDVVITDVRPSSGAYTMCVNTPSNPFDDGVLGIAPLDCFDDQAANIVFAYHSANDRFSAATQATTMSQEIAHAFGLEHVNQEDDIMNPYNAGGDPSFIDQCFTLDPGEGWIECGEQHEQFCYSGQNSHRELLWLFGAREPDVQPPTIAITSPKDGDWYAASATLTIALDVGDDRGIKRVDLYIDGGLEVSQNVGPYAWHDVSFPPGQHCLIAEAFDTSNNRATSNEVCVTIQEEETPGPSTTTSGGEQDTGSEPTPTSGGSDATDPFEEAPSEEYGEFSVSCSCSETPRGGGGALLLVAFLALRRRRA